ncbi:serine hydrolase domain-containing protein [Marinicella rhabdoformis]|uniref:serine hydrolase domain-containing protein n=1 Tax=Marinicella rhabdoformis TaxID=2580566 RepID=UPI0015CFD13A|nr:serine hydrolase domain-containing protein [Marinicella rhabdoformis]
MKIKSGIQAVMLLVSMMFSLMLPTLAVAKETVYSEQLNKLIEVMEAKRQEFHIPGMALAVVKDDQVILTQGFGQMDMANNKAVTSETLFAIGSSSKAFTATLFGMLVDDEQVNWDDLVTDYLPDYEFKVEGEVLPITFRDMLSHRTGYTRNDLLWANGQASRDLILKTATRAEPVDEFRKKFYYNNVMFLAAGEASAKISKQSWDDLLMSRLLKPLGMKGATSNHATAITDKNISKGYQWNEETESHDVMPTRNLNNIAPAGGIYSNVNDMAQWLRFQLNKGKVGSEQLLSEKQLLETHEEQIKMSQMAGYGMGWMLQEWQGKKVVEHGGNIDGFGAQVSLIPEENLGYVLLTNVTATPLQQGSIGIVFEHLLGGQQSTADPSTKVDYQKYVGEYHANFGPFKDAIFTFSVKDDGKPAVDVPGQMLYELKDPDERGKWFFALTNAISVSFDLDNDGGVAAMRMQQNGMNFELPRKGVEIKPEIETALLRPFLGGYDSEKLNGVINAKIQNHRLTMDVPNQMAFELHLPDEAGFREFRIKSDTSVKFVIDEAGTVTAFELWKNKTELVETVPKIKGEVTEVLPTVEDIMALRKSKKRLKALKKKSGVSMSGSILVKSSGITGKITSQFDTKGNFKQAIDFGIFGDINVVINDDKGSTYGINPYTEFKGKYLKQAQRENPAVWFDLAGNYEEIKVVGTSELTVGDGESRKVYQLSLKVEDLPTTVAYIDSETGDVLKAKTKVMMPSMGSVSVETTYEDYREKKGLRLPYKVNINNPMMGETVITLDQVKLKQKFNKNTFSVSQPDH